MKIGILIFALIAITLHAGESAEQELERLQRALKVAISQTDMNVASGELAKYWDQALQKEEKKILASCDAETTKLFQKAQQSWREFRKAEVAFQGDAVRGGSMQPLVCNSTFAALTERRVRDLRLYSEPK